MVKTNAKAIAQASKMSETAASNAAPKSKIELFGAALNGFVRSHFDCVEHVEGSDDYFLRKVDLGNGKVVDYRIHMEQAPAKDGVRASHKRDLYRIDEDGKERLVQFGLFKKKLLYPLMNMVVAGRPVKAAKIVVDKKLTGKIADFIRSNRKDFVILNGVLYGSVPGVGSIRLVEAVKTLKTGKTQMVRQLFIDDALKLEGGQLVRVKNAFLKTGGHRAMKDILADGNDAVSDLI